MSLEQCEHTTHIWARLRRGATRALFFVGLWWVLSGGNTGSWVVGAPTVIFATLVTLFLPAPGPWAWRPIGVAPFLLFFAWQSLRGGIDVAQRAFRPTVRLDPALIDYPLRLSEGSACVFLINAISLMPGTLSAEFDGRRLTLHVLDRTIPVVEEIQALEFRVASLFGVTLKKNVGEVSRG